MHALKSFLGPTTITESPPPKKNLKKAGSYDFIKLHLTSSNFIWLHLTLSDFIPLHLTLSDFIGLHPISSDFIQLHLTSLNFIWLHQTSCNYIRLRLTSSGFIWLHPTLSELVWTWINESYSEGLPEGLHHIFFFWNRNVDHVKNSQFNKEFLFQSKFK